MTVKLPKRVLKRWREISEESSKVRLELLLTSRLDPVAATDVLSQSLARVLDAFDAGPPQTGDEWEWWAGEWSVARVPEGAMLVGGYKSDGFEEILLAVVEDLGRTGVCGKLDLYQLPEPPMPPPGIGVIETRVRVLGRRVVNGRDRWAAEREALHRVLQSATRWCTEARPDRGVTLQHGAMPALLVRRCDDPWERLRDVMGESTWTTLRSVGDEHFRSVTVDPPEGRVTLVEGGPFLHRSGWDCVAAAATDFLRSVASDAVYAYVRRNREWRQAEFASSEPTDRLHRDHLDAIAHEECLAPDAYAIQLLGPGYAGRVPTGEDWRTIPLPEKRVLLEQVKLGPWFDEITIDEAWQGESLPRHAAVERARADLAPILFAPISKDRRERELAWDMAHPHVRLSDDIIAKVHALPTGPYVGHWDVALILRDGSVIDDVELGWQGAIVTRVAGSRKFTLDPTDVVDVRPASGG